MPIMTKILIALSIQYAMIAGGFAYYHDWPRCCYFLSASFLNIAVIFMR